MSDGKEVLAAPYAVYLAPAGTTFPAIDDDEGAFDAAWVLCGTNGTKNYVDSGVVVNLNSTEASFTGAGGTLPMNAWRTAEGAVVNFTLADVSVDQFALIMDEAQVDTVAAGTGVAGEKSFSVFRGVQTFKYAVLARGLSPENDLMFAQYELARCFQSASQSPTYTKGTPAELACEFTVLDDLINGIPGTLRVGTSPAL